MCQSRALHFLRQGIVWFLTGASTVLAGGGNLDLDAIRGLEVTPDQESASVVVRTKDGGEGGCPVTLSITVSGEVEKNGGSDDFYDEVAIAVNGMEYTLFAGDKSENEEWSLDDEFEGVEKEQSVDVKVSPGDEITLKYLTRNDYWNDGWGARIVDVQIADDCGCPAGGGEVGNGCVDVSIGLGPGPDSGGSAGAIKLHEESPSASNYTSAKLVLASGLYGYTKAERAFADDQLPQMAVINDSGNLWKAGQVLRQLWVPNAFVDIVTVSSIKYEIRFYRHSDVTERGSNGFFVLGSGATPYQIWTVENPDTSGTTVDKVKVTHLNQGKTREYLYEYIPANSEWTLTKGTGQEAIVIKKEKIFSGGTVDERVTTMDAIGNPANIEGEIKTSLPFGDYITESYTGFGASKQSTFYEYWPEDSGHNTGRIKRITRPGGRWEYFHAYDERGRVLQKVVQLKDHSFTATWPDAVNKSYVYTYTDSPTVRIIQVLTKVEGVDAKKEWYYHYTPRDTRAHPTHTLGQGYTIHAVATNISASSYADSSNLKTQTYFYAKNAVWPGKPRGVSKIIHPDGKLELFEYNEEPGGISVVKHWEGVGNSGNTQVVAGIRTETRTNRRGEVVDFAEYEIQGNLLKNRFYASVVDEWGRPTTLVYNDSTTVVRVYSCCGLSSEIDRAGMKTVFGYDIHGRVEREERWAGSNLKSFIDYTLDASGRILNEAWGEPEEQVEMPASVSEFDASGRITFSSQRGISRSYDYQDDGRRVEESLPGNAEITTLYYSDGRLKSRVGSTIVNEYYTYGIGSGGATAGFEWTEVRYASSSSPRYERTYYDRIGRVARIERPSFSGTAVEQFTYDSGSREVRRELTGYAPWLSHYDTRGRITAEGYDINGDGQLTPASNDEFTAIRYGFEQNSGASYEYTERVTYSVSGNAQETLISKDANRVTNLGLSVSSQRVITDGLGNVTTATTSINPNTRTVLETVSSATSVEDRVTTYVDGEIRHSAASADGGTTERFYDAAGRVEREVDPRTQQETTTVYESVFGNPEQVNQGSRYVRYEYYPPTHINAGLVSLQERNGQTVSFEYNAQGQLTYSYGNEYPVRYEYNSYGELVYMWTYRNGPSSNGDQTEWVRHPATGLLTSKMDAANQPVNYTYYDSGLLHTREWARGVVTTYGYTNAGHLSSVGYSDATANMTFALDRLGRRVGVSFSDGRSISRSYLGATGMTASDIYSAFGQQVAVGVGYGSYGRRASVNLSVSVGGGSANNLLTKGYAYDDYGRIQSVNSGTGGVSAAYGYFPNSDIVHTTSISRGGVPVVTTTRSVNAFGEVDAIVGVGSDNQIKSASYYNIDNHGRRTRRTNQDGTYWSYGYDSLNQVNAAQKFTGANALLPGYDFTYTYDSIGNRMQSAVDSALTIYGANSLNQYTTITNPGVAHMRGSADTSAYVTVNNEPTEREEGFFYAGLTVDNAGSAKSTDVLVSAVVSGAVITDPDQVDEVEGKVFTHKASTVWSYDEDGNLLNDGRWTYQWDAENRLVAISKSSGVEEAMVLNFTYDDYGRRRSKKVERGSGSSVSVYERFFAWDNWIMIGEWKLNGSAISEARSFLWGLDLSGSAQGAGGIGGLLASQSDSAVNIPLFDGMGNVAVALDALEGNVVASVDYSAFGEPLGFISSEILPFSFSTKYSDGEIGLLYYGYRYYNPETGRWLNQDPIEERGGMNLYGFCGNRQTNSYDAFGLLSDREVFFQLLFHWRAPNDNAAFIRSGSEWGAWARSKESLRSEARLRIELTLRGIAESGSLSGSYNVPRKTVKLDTNYWIMLSLNDTGFGFGGEFEMRSDKCLITLKRNRYHIHEIGDFHAKRYPLTDIPGRVAQEVGDLYPAGFKPYQEFPILIQWDGPDLTFELKGRKWIISGDAGWPFN